MSETERRCENCKWWKAHNYRGGPYYPPLGKCLRYPPRIFEGMGTAFFPETTEREWCGEFHPRKKGE